MSEKTSNSIILSALKFINFQQYSVIPVDYYNADIKFIINIAFLLNNQIYKNNNEAGALQEKEYF